MNLRSYADVAGYGGGGHGGGGGGGGGGHRGCPHGWCGRHCCKDAAEAVEAEVANIKAEENRKLFQLYYDTTVTTRMHDSCV